MLTFVTYQGSSKEPGKIPVETLRIYIKGHRYELGNCAPTSFGISGIN